MRVGAGQARRVLGAEFVVLTATAVDEPWLPGVRNQDLLVARLSRVRLIHGEWLPTSIATRTRSGPEEQRLSEAVGSVAMRLSSMTSPLVVPGRSRGCSGLRCRQQRWAGA